MSVMDGPGEGTWSVFAYKVVAERDGALECIRLILEADCLRDHAYERGDDEESIYEMCRRVLGKK